MLHIDYKNVAAHRRSGVALLVTIFVLTLITVWLVDMLNSEAVYESALRNTIEYEQALYLANAGVHHATAELEANTGWRGTVTGGGPGSYSATAVDGSVAGTADIVSSGVAGEVTRRLHATVQIN
jgi:Tfp pilus assembly protein PilX